MLSIHVKPKCFSKKMLTIFLLGFSSGLPVTLVGSLLQSWYRTSGIDLITVGFLSLIGQPYIYKFLWAPLLDRFSLIGFSFLDRKRGWILGCQIGIAILLLVISFGNPIKAPMLIACLAFVLAVIAATQDIAIDGYRVQSLTVEERGLGSALAVEGYRIAIIVSGGLGLMLADRFGWQITFLIMVFFMLLGMLGTCFGVSVEQKRHTAIQTKENYSFYAITLHPIKQFLSKKRSLLLIALVGCYKLTDALSHSLSSVFLLDLGFTLTAIGTINKFVGVLATLIGVIFAGIVMTRVKLFNTLLYFSILQGLTNLLYIILVVYGKNYYLAVIIFFIENLCSGMGTSAFLALITSLCNVNHAATQFALLSSVAAIGRVYIGSTSGYLVNILGWGWFYCVTAIIAIPSIVLLLLLKPQIILHDRR